MELWVKSYSASNEAHFRQTKLPVRSFVTTACKRTPLLKENYCPIQGKVFEPTLSGYRRVGVILEATLVEYQCIAIACYDREPNITGRVTSHTTNLNERLEIVETTIQLKDFELQEGGQPSGINLPSNLSTKSITHTCRVAHWLLLVSHFTSHND